MKEQLAQFWKDEEGATAIEYALIAGLMAVAIVAALATFKPALTAFFTYITGLLPTK